MKSEIENIILEYDTKGKVSKTSAFPLMMHAVINFISARDIYNYLQSRNLNVSLKSVERWRREASKVLGLSPKSAGRLSYQAQQELRTAWHAKYGYPTLRDLVNGWRPDVAITEFQNEGDAPRPKPTVRPEPSTSPTRTRVTKVPASTSNEADKSQKTQKSECENSTPTIDLSDIKQPIKEEVNYSDFIQ